MFTLVDLILVGLLMIFAGIGLALGLIQAIGGLIGLAVGGWAAINFYAPVASWLTPIFFNQAALAKLVAFSLIFILASRLAGLIFWFFNKIFKIFSLIPFLGSLNRLGGFCLGLVEGILILGVLIFVTIRFFGDISWLIERLDQSRIAHLLLYSLQFLTGLFS